jgi:hypothetical protein
MSTESPLDPEFIKDVQANAKEYDTFQSESDDSKWTIARKTNEMWPEHKGLVVQDAAWEEPKLLFPTKMDYYMEVSRVANMGLRKKRFSDSGETLRRWCEVQETYSQFPQADLLLSEVSFDHLVKAKKLAKDGKVKSPIHALAWAMNADERHTADEMKEHFDPSLPTHPYDQLKGWLAGMLNKATWSFFKNKEDIDYVTTRAREIQDRVSSVLRKEGKAE